MKKFRFRLQPLLEKRKRVEADRQRELAQAQRHQLAIEQRLRQMRANIDDGKRELADRLSGRVDAVALRSQAAMTMHLDAQARRLALHLAEAYRACEYRRKRLIEASIQRKSIERLKERRFEQWRRELENSQRVIIDDVVSTRYAQAVITAQSGDEA